MDANREKYRKVWLRLHKSYERKALKILLKYFKDQALSLPIDHVNVQNYKETIDKNIKIGPLYNAYIEMYTVIGVIHGERIGKQINRDIKDFNMVTFESEYRRGLLDWIMDNVGNRIVSVRQQYVEYIQKLIRNGFRDGMTNRQMATALHGLIGRRDFYRWQSLRIVRTETTSASNHAASTAGETSGIALQKEWISIPDARTRRRPEDRFDHAVMDGVKVMQNEFFNVQGEFIEYPGAAVTREGNQSSAANVINCRCTVALIPVRDADGRIVRSNNVRVPLRRASTLPKPKPIDTAQSDVFKPAKSIKEVEQRIRDLGISKVKLTSTTVEEGNVILKTLIDENKFSPLHLTELVTKNGKNLKFYGRYFARDRKIDLNITGARGHVKKQLVSYEVQLEKIEKKIKEVDDIFDTLNDWDKRRYSNWKKDLYAIRRKLQNRIDRNEQQLYWSMSTQAEDHLEKIRRTLIHEIGHNRHYVNFDLTKQIGLNWQNTPITEYSKYNFKEYLAEWYTQWRLYGDKNVPNVLLNLFKTL